MSDSKIGTREAISIVLTIAITHTILSMPRTLLTNMRSAILLNLILVGLVLVSLVILVTKLFKNFPGSDILDVAEFLGGKNFKRILGLFFITYFIVSSSLLLREFAEALKIIYYPMTNIIFIILFFIICVAITSKLEFAATIKANLIIAPIILLSTIFLFTANLRNFTPTRIFPLLGNGFIDTFILGLGNISSFAGISFLYLIPPLLKEPKDLKKISVTSIIMFFSYLILNVAVILFMFSFFMSDDEILTLYSAARYIQIGSFFVRFESIFLLIWLQIFACYLSIVVKFCMLILQKMTNIENSKIFGYSFAILMLGVSLLPSTYAQVKHFEVNIYPNIVLGFSYTFCILLLIFANIKRKKERKVGVMNNASNQ